MEKSHKIQNMMKNPTRNEQVLAEDDIILPTAEGLIRLREEELNNEDNNNQPQVVHDNQHDLFTKFSQESLHSFKFTSTTTNRKLYGTLPGHFHSSELISKTNNRNKTKTVGSPMISKTNHFRQKSLPPISESPTRTMSNSSTSTTQSVKTPSTTVYDEEEEEEEVSVPHLHNRIKQQHQAILTTYDDWRIILINNIAQDLLVSHNINEQLTLIGKSVMDLIDPSYKNRLRTIITKRRNELNKENNMIDNGMVLVCGNVIPIIKLDGTKSSASLWLKEKINESGQSVFIWIFEEVYESSITLNISNDGYIESVLCKESLKDLYDYEEQHIIGKNLNILIPSLTDDWRQYIEQHRFFASQTKKEAQFPIIVKLLQENQIQIISMPMIAGLVTIKSNGLIEGCNDIFVRYLFGFSQADLVDNKNIKDLLPQFPTLIENLKRDDLLQHGLIINNIVCRKLLLNDNNTVKIKSRTLTQTPNNQPLPILVGIHRDGTQFEIQLQLKLVEGEEGYALWISFDRELTFKRFGHQHLITCTKQQEEEKVQKPIVENNKEIVYSAQQSSRSATIEDYEIMDTLGEGAYGLVKLAIKKDDPSQTKIVIKYVIKSRILVDCWTRDRKLGILPAEIHILHTLRKNPHENLGDMLDYFEDNEYYYIVMGLHGDSLDLFDYIELNEHTPELELKQIFKQISLGVQHLHNLNIVHRDIKDENVVLDQLGGLRLIDFGSAAYLKPGRQYETFVGTLDYAAPEILRGQTYSGKPQDIWALGILLFTLIYRENPFYNIDEIMERELRIPFVLSEGSVDLISKMLERDVDKRIDIHQVLAHPWLN